MDAELRALTDEELFEVTGYRYPSKQLQTLREAGIFAIYKRPTNSIFTTWYHVQNPRTDASTENVAIKPNFEALD